MRCEPFIFALENLRKSTGSCGIALTPYLSHIRSVKSDTHRLAMTAAVADLLPIPSFDLDLSLADPSVDARKRRREILSSQRHVDATPDELMPSSDLLMTKSSKIEDDESSFKKKPQMKYDPDVPMTKEEAAVWRREQRRKRNRESAAASRQRQRDRIGELEAELDEWKQKYEEVLKKVRLLEERTGDSSAEIPLTSEIDRVSTPPPEAAATVTPRASPTASKSLVTTGEEDEQVEDGEEEEMLPSKMISRPA